MKSTIRSKTLKFLAYAKIAASGGIAGVAFYNTALLIISASPDQGMESLAMAAGGVLATGLAKILHVV